MLPSLGYFGGVDANFDEQPIKRDVAGLIFVLTDPRPTYLNLRGFTLRDNGGTCDAKGLVRSAALSSVRDQDRHKDPASALNLGGIHSDKEFRPRWSVSFREPVRVESIRIYNRLDGVGRRSFAHELWVIDSEGNEARISRRGAGETFLQTIRLLKSLPGQDFRGSIPVTVEAQSQWRGDTVRSVVRVIRSKKPLTLTRTHSNLLFGLLPTRAHADLIDEDWFLLAYLLLQQRTRVLGTRTGIRSFSSILSSPARVKRLQDEFEEAESLLGIEPHWITDGGIRSNGPSDRP
jgi:hypothetical protein